MMARGGTKSSLMGNHTLLVPGSPSGRAAAAAAAALFPAWIDVRMLFKHVDQSTIVWYPGASFGLIGLVNIFAYLWLDICSRVEALTLGKPRVHSTCVGMPGGGGGGSRGRSSETVRWSDVAESWRLRLPTDLEFLGEAIWRRPETLSSAVVSPVSSKGLGVASSRLTVVVKSKSIWSWSSRGGVTDEVRL